VDYLRQNV